MGRGLAHKKFGNSLPMIHKIDLKNCLDGIPLTTLLTKTKDNLGKEDHMKDLLCDTTKNKKVYVLYNAKQDARNKYALTNKSYYFPL